MLKAPGPIVSKNRIRNVDPQVRYPLLTTPPHYCGVFLLEIKSAKLKSRSDNFDATLDDFNGPRREFDPGLGSGPEFQYEIPSVRRLHLAHTRGLPPAADFP